MIMSIPLPMESMQEQITEHGPRPRREPSLKERKKKKAKRKTALQSRKTNRK